MFTLTVYIQGNDNAWRLEFNPHDYSICDIWSSSNAGFNFAPQDIAGLFVSVGTFPNCKTITLEDALKEAAAREFNSNHAEFYEGKREEDACQHAECFSDG